VAEVHHRRPGARDDLIEQSPQLAHLAGPVGAPTLIDCLHATRVHGTVCMSGMLSDQWTLPDFYPTGDIPRGVRLTGYTGDATDLPPSVLQDYLDAVAAGDATVPIGCIFQLDEIREAHRVMEAGTAHGKIVVLTGTAA
jgi:NADPH2:quinone reductase